MLLSRKGKNCFVGALISNVIYIYIYIFFFFRKEKDNLTYNSLVYLTFSLFFSVHKPCHKVISTD